MLPVLRRVVLRKSIGTPRVFAIRFRGIASNGAAMFPRGTLDDIRRVSSRSVDEWIPEFELLIGRIIARLTCLMRRWRPRNDVDVFGKSAYTARFLVKIRFVALDYDNTRASLLISVIISNIPVGYFA